MIDRSVHSLGSIVTEEVEVDSVGSTKVHPSLLSKGDSGRIWSLSIRLFTNNNKIQMIRDTTKQCVDNYTSYPL